ncbi:MAG: hypothetical protein AAFP90_14790, partial [Planctomycetota bacterium]
QADSRTVRLDVLIDNRDGQFLAGVGCQLQCDEIPHSQTDHSVPTRRITPPMDHTGWRPRASGVRR